MLFDVIVCGAGVQGLWTANYLAEQKQSVLLLEQFPFPHTRGSSHGPSRIIRYSYVTEHHTKMMPEAYKRWNELEDSQKTKLLVQCGILSFGHKEYTASIEKAMLSQNMPYEKLHGSEISRRFPGLAGGKLDGIYEKTGGVLKANHCLLALKASFESLGGVMHDEERVHTINPISNTQVEVVTQRKKYQANSIILTCGSFINKILKPLNFQIPAQPYKVTSNYWQAKNPELFKASNGFPATILCLNNGNHVYSTPILEYPGLMKVSNHSGAEVDPDRPSVYDKNVEKTLQEQLLLSVEQHYPNLNPLPVLFENCMYTTTPDADFILDRHPQYKNVIIGAGFSGHGFKLSPTVGRILGDLALDRTPHYDMKKFSLKRFDLKSNL